MIVTTKKFTDSNYLPKSPGALGRSLFQGIIDELVSLTNTEIDKKSDKIQPVLIVPTLLNGWTTLNTPQYYKDNFGVVHVIGRIINGTTTVSTNLFTLPVGYRPPSDVYLNSITYSTTSDSAPCALTIIAATGNVSLSFPSKTVIILDFSFRV